jgi:site-specific recombinase XerD
MKQSVKPIIYLDHGYSKGRRVIWIRFDYNRELSRILGETRNYRWNTIKKAWNISADKFHIDDFVETIGRGAKIISNLKGGQVIENIVTENSEKLPDGFLELLQQKRYSESTVKIYATYFRQFQTYFAGYNLQQITARQINNYIVKLIHEKKISPSQQNQRINAIKFYYEKVLGSSRIFHKLGRPKKERKLPTVLSKEEVNLLLNIISNLKHKCVLTTIYSAGLRRSELINLKIEDIDSKRRLIRIKGAKGKKDRYTILSGKLILMLREYYNAYLPQEWLFEGQHGGKYSATSIAKICKNASQKAGIQKNVTPHSLRHSFATHLLEQGTNLRYIQEILGHEDPKTTQIYTRVATNELSNIRSPLDDFG